MLKQLKYYLLKVRTHWAAKNFKITRESTNFFEAKDIGILFSIREANNQLQLNEFVKNLESSGKNIRAMAYLEASHPTEFTFPYEFFNDEDINLLGVLPKAIVDFMACPFDYLYFISDTPHKSLKYILQGSHARCRVGTNCNLEEWPLEMTVNISKSGSLGLAIRQLELYVKRIN